MVCIEKKSLNVNQWLVLKCEWENELPGDNSLWTAYSLFFHQWQWVLWCTEVSTLVNKAKYFQLYVD